MDESGPLDVWVEGDKLIPPTYDKPESSARGNKLCEAPKVFFRYASGTVVELANGPHGGGVFIGEKGRITIDRGRCVSDTCRTGSTASDRARNRSPMSRSVTVPRRCATCATSRAGLAVGCGGIP